MFSIVKDEEVVLETVERKNACLEIMKNWSIFGIRFGVYIDKSTRFVSNFAVVISYCTYLIFMYVILS